MSVGEHETGSVHELSERETPETLTVRQRRVLEVIRTAIDDRGYPPSMREIGDRSGLSSPSSVAHQLKTLEAKGFIRRDPNRPRALEILAPPSDEMDVTDIGEERPDPSFVPVLGQIAAGGPILAEMKFGQLVGQD